MKLLFTSTILSAVLLAASTVNAAQCTSGNCVTNQNNFNGIRQYGGIGTKNWTRFVLDKPSKGWFRTEWNKVMGKVVNDPQTCAFEKHYPTLATKFRWSDAYINENVKPTRAQAKDPNWSNYVWNRTENGDGFVYDGIKDALNDPLINNGAGIAKLSVMVALTSTSGRLIPPQWMRNDKSLTWVEGTNTNGSTDNWHVRFDNPKAVDHAADFLAAFLAKYGNNKGLHSVNLGEYFFGQKDYWPSGINWDTYRVGVKNLWEKIVSSAPRDADGNRVNIIQTNPLFNAQVTINDLERLGLGMSESDTRIDLPVTRSPETETLRKLYDGKKVHVMINGDSRYACIARRQYWDGTPNPFGHKKGYSAIATPQEIFWYHSEKGPVPTHSLFMTTADYCSDAPQTRANFIDAIKKFGRCGTEASKWGAVPAALPNSNDARPIALGKPNPPPAVNIR